MKRYRCSIIIPTHSSYIDVCNSFIQVLNTSWKECKFKVILAVTGEDKRVEGVENIYCGLSATLPQCIMCAKNKYPSMYYMVLLGDAFILNKVKNSDVDKLLDALDEKKVNYCSLRPRHGFHTERTTSHLIRKINVKERYAFSFIAFIATDKFLNIEFKDENVTDLDFELKYIYKSQEKTEIRYYQDCYIVTNNLFGIFPGIEKGKWERKVLKKIKSICPGIDLESREKLTLKEEFLVFVYNKFGWFIPSGIRSRIKKVLRKYVDNFFVTTD